MVYFKRSFIFLNSWSCITEVMKSYVQVPQSSKLFIIVTILLIYNKYYITWDPYFPPHKNAHVLTLQCQYYLQWSVVDFLRRKTSHIHILILKSLRVNVNHNNIKDINLLQLTIICSSNQKNDIDKSYCTTISPINRFINCILVLTYTLVSDAV